MYIWFSVGFIGWILMLLYRICTTGYPKNIKLNFWFNGLILALLLGGFVFPVGISIIVWEKYNE